jgi:hypothetical protein
MGFPLNMSLKDVIKGGNVGRREFPGGFFESINPRQR